MGERQMLAVQTRFGIDQNLLGRGDAIGEQLGVDRDVLPTSDCTRSPAAHPAWVPGGRTQQITTSALLNAAPYRFYGISS